LSGRDLYLVAVGPSSEGPATKQAPIIVPGFPRTVPDSPAKVAPKVEKMAPDKAEP